MHEFHMDKERYFRMNIATTTQFIIPFIRQVKELKQGMRVLDLGCGEGGILKSFLDLGLQGVGIEMDAVRIKDAQVFLKEYIERGDVKFLTVDIYDPEIEQDFSQHKFDIILLKDVIEHIPQQEKMITYLGKFLNQGGVIFVGFPPWQMPFGGHQQILKNKILSRTPYYHLLPRRVYQQILEAAGENVQEMMDIRDTGISIERFEIIVRAAGYKVLNQKHYLLNPIYQFKFGWKAREQWKYIQRLRGIRNFFTTGVYYLIGKQEA